MNAKQYKCAKHIRWQLKVDAPTMLSIATAAALCVLAAALAHDSGMVGESPPRADPLALDGEVLLALEEMEDAYRNDGQEAEADEQEEMFRQKVTEVARGLLGVEITSVYVDLFLPGPPDPLARPGQICGSAYDIPAHLAKVRDAEWYAVFMEKYSAYPIVMGLNDERPELGFHYDFTAQSEDGKSATTYFHVDTCTGEVTDPESYLLICRDMESGYFFSTPNRNDTMASLKLDDFCVVPISQWRQSLYDYAKEASEETHRHFMGGGPVDDYEALMAFWHEGEWLDALTDLAYAAASDRFADDVMQEKIQKYRDAYGDLPEDFLELLEGQDDE